MEGVNWGAWAVVIALAGQFITWIGGIALFAKAWGKWAQRVTNAEDEISGLKNTVYSPDHKILTEDAHRMICGNHQNLLQTQLNHLCAKVDDTRKTQKDHGEKLDLVKTQITRLVAITEAQQAR